MRLAFACLLLIAALNACGMDRGHGDPPLGTPQTYTRAGGAAPAAAFPAVCPPDIDCGN